MIIKETVKIGDKEISIETGRIAKQASGSVVISQGETVVLVTACGTTSPRPGMNFMPLSCDYVEKMYAAGKIPGGFFKREGQLREHEILTSRCMDRPVRPLFPEGYRNEIQVIATVISSDSSNMGDMLAITGASAALHISAIPWDGPIAGVRVGRVDGKLVANPTREEMEQSDCDIVVAASKDAIVMVEGELSELTEEELNDALWFGHQSVQGVIELIEKLRKAVGKEKFAFEPVKRDEAIDKKVRELAYDKCVEACQVREKHARYAKHDEVKAWLAEQLEETFPENIGDVKEAYGDLKSHVMRTTIVEKGERVDARDTKTVRPIDIEVGWIPRTHGSSLFTRGETQGIVTTTLGTRMDEQKMERLDESFYRHFMLHYNFPAYSVGEVKPLRSPGRREIGHGNLAHRALSRVLPDKDEFPYTIRIVSEITESNGSSSMATVCGGSLSLMDAGVPIKAPVAGVAMGLIKEGDNFAVLTDILGDEDHIGDMDFKVCGTSDGITAIQMDIKIGGLTREIMSQALDQAKDARLHILSKMNAALSTPRDGLSKYAPRIETITVKPDQIRTIIGPGGKMIKAICDQTGATVNVEDDGTVTIASPDKESIDQAIEFIKNLTTEPEVGQTYKGIVRRVEPYGAFLEIMPGKDGLLHISDFAWERVEKVEDIMDLGDEVEVQISNIDRDGKIKLSRKALLEKPEGYVEPEPRESRRPRGRGDRDDRGRGGDRKRRGDRGDRSGDRDRRPRRRRNRDDNKNGSADTPPSE